MTFDRFFTLELVDGELGPGVRVYDTENNVYESRQRDGAGIRLYTADDEWQVKVRKPYSRTPTIDDGGRAYRTLMETADLLESGYDVDLSMDPDTFTAQYDTDSVQIETDGITISVNQEHGVEFPERTLWRLDVGDSAIYGYVAAYGLETAAASTALVPASAPVFAGAYLGVVGASVGTYGTEKVLNHRTKKKLQQSGALEDDVFSQINELNRLEGLRNVQSYTNALSEDQEQRSSELAENDPEETLETLMNLQFHDFDQLKGVFASTHTGTYQDATAFAKTATASNPLEACWASKNNNTPDAPSVYQNPDLFTSLLSETAAYSERDDREYLLDAGCDLIMSALERDDTVEAVDAFIEDEYPRVLDEVGIDFLGGDYT